MNKKVLFGGILFIIIGVTIAVFGFMPANSERKADTDNWNRLSAGAGKEATGTVVDTEYDARTEGSRRSRTINAYYCPVYEFVVNGQTRQVTGLGDDCKEAESDVIMGSTAAIIYDQDKPETAFVKSDATAAFYKDGEGSQILAAGLGFALIIGGVIAMISARPKSPEKIAAAEEKRRKANEELEKLMAEVDQTKK